MRTILQPNLVTNLIMSQESDHKSEHEFGHKFSNESGRASSQKHWCTASEGNSSKGEDSESSLSSNDGADDEESEIMSGVKASVQWQTRCYQQPVGRVYDW